MKYVKIIISMLLIVCLIGCGSGNSELYSSPGEGFITINNIDNLAFCVPASISNKATAITKITDDADYESNAIYSYKNGMDEYVLFCMNELIIMAKKGTTFNFASSNDKGSCLNNSGILNTWFDVLGKKYSYADKVQDSTYKIIGNVSAEVVITTELYGDFIGKLAVIQNNDDEWSLFVGVKGASIGDLSDQQMNILNSVTKSMHLAANPVVEEPSYDVVINEDPFTVMETATTETNTEIETEIETADITIEEVTTEIDTSLEETVDSTEYIEETETTEEESIIDNSSDKVTVISRPNNNERKGLNLTNQKKVKKEIGKAYPSDEYSMLNIGQSGVLSAFDSSMKEEQPVIRINKIYTGNEAKDLVRKNADSVKEYSYFDAPDGYSWHVAEYDISYSSCINKAYVDIKLEGLDGNPLKYRGIPIAERTHDANFKAKEEDKSIYGCLVYYAVPNGCKEYSLKCGEGDTKESNKFMAAYYYIKE